MAARRRPTGLTTPRVENAELQRFLDQVSQRIDGLSGEIGSGGGTGTGTSAGGGGGGVPSGGGGFLPTVPILDTPPTPGGLDVFCGIGICILSWENPFRIYANHGRTIIYRGTTDRFDEAAQIGQATYFVFVDETGLEDNTEYFYWIRWVSSTDVEGPVSDVVSSTTGVDPEAVYDAIIEWLGSSPLQDALASDILQPDFVLEEIRRLSATITLLSASAADAAADAASTAQTAADSAQTTADTANTAASAAQTAAAAAQTAASAAETEAAEAKTAADNAETTAAAAQAEAARAQAAANAAAQKADDVDTKATNAQNTANTAATQSLTALNAANAGVASANEALAQALNNAQDIGTLERADRLVVQINGNARNQRWNTSVVAGSNIDIGTHQTDTEDDVTVEVFSMTASSLGGGNSRYDLLLEPDLIDWTAGTLYIRITGTDIDLTQARVQAEIEDIGANEEWFIDEDVAKNPLAAQITSLSTSIDGKADASALTGLTTRVTTNEDGIESHTAQITALEARLVSTSLGPEQNEFTGADRAAAEAARDTYFTANPTKLQEYNADTQLNIRLTWGVLRVFQHRVSDEETPPTFSWSDNGEVEPTAAAISTLNATVNQQGRSITANSDAITALTVTVGGKADSSDLDTKADATALTALTNRITVNEGSIESNQENITLLEGIFDGVELGPPQNTFSAESKADAETARDTYFTANADNLLQYDSDADLHIRLLYGVDTQYQNRSESAWQDIDADPRASGRALTTLSNTVTQNKTDIATNASSITTLSNSIANKADTTAVSALTTRVSANETAITTNASSITTLTTSLANKADTTAVTALTTRVSANEKNITTNTSSITTLTTSIANKADSTALTALTSRVKVNEDNITTFQNSITTLTASINNKAESSAVTALTNRVSANETSIAANQSSITTLSTAVGGKADTTVVTALTNRVTANEGNIKTNQDNITSLTTTVGGKADADALTALTNRVRVNESRIIVNQNDVTRLTANLDGIDLGPEQNTFTGEDEDAAVTARDTWFSADSDRLTAYNDDRTLHIRLLYGTTTKYQRRNNAGTRWRDNTTDPLAKTSALTAISNRVTANATGISTNASAITDLTTTVGAKADTTALTALTNRVDTTEDSITTIQGNITTLTSVVNAKPDQSDVDLKADATAVTALTNRVTVNETGIETNQNEVTTLEATLDGITLGPDPHTFTGADRAAAEAARDAYSADNGDWLLQYFTDTNNHIRLEFGDEVVYQNYESPLVDSVRVGVAASVLNDFITYNNPGDSILITTGRGTTGGNYRLLSRTGIPNPQGSTLGSYLFFSVEPGFDWTNYEGGANRVTYVSDSIDNTMIIRLREGSEITINDGIANGYELNQWSVSENTQSVGSFVDVDADPRASTSAVTNLGTRITETESGVEANTREITALESRITSRNLGPATNEFTGATRADAETARDTYATANPTWLAQYDADSSLNIRLTYNSGALRVYQNRDNSAWVDNGEVEATAAAVTTLSATVTQNTTNIQTNANNITSLTNTVAGKADTSALDALQTEIDANEAGVTANSTAITALRASVSEFVPGMEQNDFIGADRSAAETARDTYASANMAWLTDYNDNPKNYILLHYD